MRAVPRLLLSVLLGSFAASTLAPAAAVARASSLPTPRIDPGRMVGSTPPNERVEFDLVLAIPHEADFDAFVARVNDPSSPDYHHYASAEQIGERFGISDDALAHVQAWVVNAGLQVLERFPQRTTLRVAGPARWWTGCST